MGSFGGAENYIFWQPMVARLSISLWQFYGILMIANCRETPRSLWQLFCTDHKCRLIAFQSYFYGLEVKNKMCKKKRKITFDHVMLNITNFKMINRSVSKASLFE
jgi:hypothetical protein